MNESVEKITSSVRAELVAAELKLNFSSIIENVWSFLCCRPLEWPLRIPASCAHPLQIPCDPTKASVIENRSFWQLLSSQAIELRADGNGTAIYECKKVSMIVPIQMELSNVVHSLQWECCSFFFFCLCSFEWSRLAASVATAAWRLAAQSFNTEQHTSAISRMEVYN